MFETAKWPAGDGAGKSGGVEALTGHAGHSIVERRVCLWAAVVLVVSGAWTPAVAQAPSDKWEVTVAPYLMGAAMGYTGPITLSNSEKFQYVREMLKKEGISIPLPTGN